MPRILLLGAKKATLDAVSDLPHQFAAGIHGAAVRDAPAPTEWDLIVHLFCKVGNFGFGKDVELEVNNHYLSEALCPQIHLSYGGECLVIVHGPVGGYRSFEALPGSDRFQHVLDLFEELGGHLSVNLYVDRRTVPGRSTEILAENQYGQTIAALWEREPHAPLFAMIPPRDEEAQPHVVRHLVSRTLPKLFPGAYLSEFVPERVRALEAEKDELIARSRERAREIDAAIHAELDYYAPFSVLPKLRDGALRGLVARVLEEFGYTATDLDEHKDEGRKETYDSDLMLEADAAKGYCETKSSGNRNCSIKDLEDCARNVEKARELYGQEDHVLLVYNGQIDTVPEKRGPTFSGDVIREAVQQGIALTTGADLLRALESVRSGSLTPEEIRSRLRIPGLVDLTP